MSAPSGTLSYHNSEDNIMVEWYLFPLLIGGIFYFAICLATWPYAKSILPLWIFLLFFLFPPLFPFLLLYLLFATWVVMEPASVRRADVVIVQASTRGRTLPPPTRVFPTRGNQV